MKHILTLMFFLISYIGLMAQCPTNIEFTSQSQIDSFAILYPNCTEFPGNIYINQTDITNLDGLNNIVMIKGSLELWSNNELLTLDGLENLTYVGGSLFIVQSDSLLNLNGLGKILHVEDTIIIRNCDNLTNLVGLESLKIASEIWINGNSKLNNLVGLDSLASVEVLYLYGNQALNNLQGLTQLKSIKKSLFLTNNPILSDITSLDIVDTFGTIRLADLSNLLSIDGISPVDSTLHGDFIIRDGFVA